jgi:hypothetical protein
VPTIGWLVDAPVERQADGSATSRLASARYRCLVPAREIAARGGQCAVIGDVGRSDPAAILRALQRRGVDTVIVGKPLGPAMVEAARLVRTGGMRLIADFSDDFFADPRFGVLNRQLAMLADGVTASTPALAVAIQHHTGRHATIISDPFEGPRGTIRFAPARDRLQLLWFGNENNYSTIAPIMPQLLAFSAQQPLRLTIVTALDRVPRLYASPSAGFAVDHVPWATETLWRSLAACDAVIIPSLATHYHAAKSPNRLVEALWAGRAVAAHPVPSYADFAAFCGRGHDIAAALAAMIVERGAVERQIAAGQDYVARHHAPAVIAGMWLDCVRSLAAAVGRAPAASQP